MIADLDSRRAEHVSFLLGDLGVLGYLPTNDPALSLLAGGDLLSTVAAGPSAPRKACASGSQLFPSADRTQRGTTP